MPVSQIKSAPSTKVLGSLGGFSGYAGDTESNGSSTPPSSIELTSRQKKRYVVIDFKLLNPDGKRPKPSKEELNYMARNVTNDMAKGGSPSKTKSHQPHVLPSRSNVDMSQVMRIPARRYDAAACQVQQTTSPAQQASIFRLFEQFSTEVAHMYNETQHNDLGLKDFYQGLEKARSMNPGRLPIYREPTNGSDTFDSEGTSSFTESDGDTGESGSSNASLSVARVAASLSNSDGTEERSEKQSTKSGDSSMVVLG